MKPSTIPFHRYVDSSTFDLWGTAAAIYGYEATAELHRMLQAGLQASGGLINEDLLRGLIAYLDRMITDVEGRPADHILLTLTRSIRTAMESANEDIERMKRYQESDLAILDALQLEQMNAIIDSQADNS